MKLFLNNVFNHGKQFITCRNSAGDIVLTLDAEAGGHDCKAMETAGLEPANDEDVFTYANHLLGGKFKEFDFEHIEQSDIKF